MTYLSRNKTLLDEIRAGFTLVRGSLIGKSRFSETTFTSLGSYYSSSLEHAVYLGIKETPSRLAAGIQDRILARELAILECIYASELGGEIPLVFGHLRTPDNYHLGTLCEDFSEGGRFEVKDNHGKLPTELRKIFNATETEMSDDDHLAHASFMVNGKRRLGDFDNLLTSMRDKFASTPIYREIRGNCTQDYIVLADGPSCRLIRPK